MGCAMGQQTGGTRTAGVSDDEIDAFRRRATERGRAVWRDLPWRHTDDPWAILVSEVMLQQTQVSRVEGKWEAWMESFPSARALADAPLEPVLALWQGLGYNRRALNLKRAAEIIAAEHAGHVPADEAALLSLPGVGPATAAGVRAFAWGLAGVYLETNVRAVFIHEFFAGRERVTDAEIVPLVRATCPDDGPAVREWYWALLDWGARLKREGPNPTRRSGSHTVQSAFEGSHRQKRAWLLRRVLEAPCTTGELAAALADYERAAGRTPPTFGEVAAIVEELAGEGFVECAEGVWHCAE